MDKVSNNPRGRPVGSKNKTTVNLTQAFREGVSPEKMMALSAELYNIIMDKDLPVQDRMKALPYFLRHTIYTADVELIADQDKAPMDPALMAKIAQLIDEEGA